ncbi:MAG TPA: PilZ domain-containing protein [Anaerolineae bacterium]|nr:PilZ domain-containing protein [Anaerolineae bacterium]
MNGVRERRVSPRFAAQYPVFYYYLPYSAPRTRTINLSKGGAGIEALDRLPLGASVAFLIVMDEDKILNATGTVIHVEPREDARYSIGVQFSALPFQGHDTLTRSLRSLSGEPTDGERI